MSDMPTTPGTDHEIEAIFGDGSAADPRRAVAGTMVGEWRRLFAFLKRPSLDVSAQSDSPFIVLGRIYALDMLAMLVLVTLAGAAIAAGFYIPQTALAGQEFTPALILLVILGAPVLEEVGFRSWLSGKPGHIGALILVGVGVAGFAVTHGSTAMAGTAILAAALIGAVAALIVLRKRPSMRWFVALFPGFFWLSTFAFALVHLANFEEGALGILLPLVLPQLILGGLLGYVRVRIGLWAAILLHAVHNATAMGIAMLAMAIGDAG